MRCIVVELKLEPKDLISIFEVIPTNINECPTERRRRNDDGTTRTTLEVMTGIWPRLAMLKILPDDIELAVLLSIQ